MRGAGRSLAQRLAPGGELVPDVPAKLAARVRVYSRGHGRKTDKHDAVPIGLAALDGTGIRSVACDDVTVSLRLPRPARRALRAAHPGTCRLHRLLAELTPGGMRRELTANKAQALLARTTWPPSGCTSPATTSPASAPSMPGSSTSPASRNGTGPSRRVLRRSGPPPAVAGREPQELPPAAHDGRHPDPPPRHRRATLLRAQDPQGGAALPQAPALRPGLPAARPRPAGHNRNVRITCDPADAACIHLTGGRLTRGRTSIPATPPPGVQAFIVLDWKDDRLIGIEVLDASTSLHPDLLEEPEILS
jgi:hypothetical protein